MDPIAIIQCTHEKQIRSDRERGAEGFDGQLMGVLVCPEAATDTQVHEGRHLHAWAAYRKGNQNTGATTNEKQADALGDRREVDGSFFYSVSLACLPVRSSDARRRKSMYVH